ncbi:MAG: hypothetical protein WCO63_10660 [Bacteroidota bacterium]
MKDLLLDIKPKSGLGPLTFGSEYNTLIEYLGKPEDLETLEDEDEFSTLVLNYWDHRITVFLEGIEKQTISCFEIENDKALLYGHWAFNLKEEDVVRIMQEAGFSQLDIADEEWGERRVSFEDAMTDFFFDKEDKLISVNWGVYVNDQGEVEDI